jgi:uncharacterized protein
LDTQKAFRFKEKKAKVFSMQRCYQVSRELLKFLNDREPSDLSRDVSLTWERIHSMGSARIAALLAGKRGVNVELSYAAGALHDFGRFVTGKQENHAENGYEPAKDFLRSLNIFAHLKRFAALQKELGLSL